MPLNHITLVNGGVGSGKTTLCISLAVSSYYRARRRVKVQNFILKLLHKKSKPMPLLYSNLPIKGIPYVPLTAALLYGDTNFVPRSVVIFTEGSLSASSMDFKTIDYEKLTKGIKLFRHRTLGGRMFIDTQAVSDLHFVFKRSINSYLWIEKFTRFPFVLCFRLRTMLYQDEQSVQNVSSKAHSETQLLFRWSFIWKRFDSYNFYGLYEKTPLEKKTKKISMKAPKRSLRSYDFIYLPNYKKGDVLNAKNNSK